MASPPAALISATVSSPCCSEWNEFHDYARAQFRQVTSDILAQGPAGPADERDLPGKRFALGMEHGRGSVAPKSRSRSRQGTDLIGDSRRGSGARQILTHFFRDVGDSASLFHEGWRLGQTVLPSHHREDFVHLFGIDPEVFIEVRLRLQDVHGIPRHLREDFNNFGKKAAAASVTVGGLSADRPRFFMAQYRMVDGLRRRFFRTGAAEVSGIRAGAGGGALAGASVMARGGSG